MFDVLLYAYTVQAVETGVPLVALSPCVAWFRVRMVWSLVKPPAKAGRLSRIGDYLLAAQGLNCCDGSGGVRPFLMSVDHSSPPDPLFHRRPLRRLKQDAGAVMPRKSR